MTFITSGGRSPGKTKPTHQPHPHNVRPPTCQILPCSVSFHTNGKEKGTFFTSNRGVQFNMESFTLLYFIPWLLL